MIATQHNFNYTRIDQYVGQRIRLQREALGLSQQQLGEQLGITFQQIQKYERGANRVSASKLYAISSLLEVSVLYFFEGIEETPKDPTYAKRGDLGAAKLFSKIEDQNAKKEIKKLIKSIIDSQ